jgi:F-box interacting protein
LISTTSPHETQSIDLEASFDDDTDSVSFNPINFIHSKHYPYIEIKSSCRGFILLYCSSRDGLDSTFYLWNPSSGLYKEIPLSPLTLSFMLDAYAFTEYFCGFGYDQLTDDYLMVSMSSGTNSSFLEFFSIRDNTWKKIDIGTYIDYTNLIENDPKVGLFFNGAIHWLVAYNFDLHKNVIVSIDLKERKLLDMHLPDLFDSGIVLSSDLWVFREFLSVWTSNYGNGTIEISVMKEYKVHSSWTKIHVFPIDDIFTNYFSPLYCTKSGDIVGTNSYSTLVKYNAHEGQFLEHHYYNDLYRYKVVMYTESLLSLPGDNVQAKENGTNNK